MANYRNVEPVVPASKIKFNNWRDRLIQGHFRGAKFYVSEHRYIFGRRTKVWEKWKSNWAVTRDYGGKAEYWELEAYVIANKDNNFDHWPDRQKLIKALKKGQWGVLFHPYLGKLWVKVYGEQVMREETERGGITVFEMKFVQNQADWSVHLAKTTSPQANVDAAAKVARDKVKDATASALSNSSALYKDSLLDGIKNILATMSTGLSSMRNVLSTAINESINIISGIITTIDAFLDTPCELMNQLERAEEQFKNIVGMGEEAINDLIEGTCSGMIYEGGSVLDGSEIPQETGESVINTLLDPVFNLDTDNFSGVVSTQIESGAVIQAGVNIFTLSIISEIMIRTDFVSRSEYEAALASIAQQFENILAMLGQYNGTAPMYQAAEELRGAFFSNAIARINENAVETSYVVPAAGMTGLQFAYNHYKDLSRYKEPMELNKNIVHHPGFLPGGETLVVLDE